MKGYSKRKDYSFGWREIVGIISLLLLFIMAGTGVGLVAANLRRLPSLAPIEEYKGVRYWEFPTKVYDRNGELLAEFFELKRELVALPQVPQHLVNAFIAIEDTNFYQHRGISLRGIARAFWANFKAGRIAEGGSTITQQLAKVLFLTSEKTYARKFQEALLAIQIERRYTKEEILERYLNKIYFGHGVYGVGAAANFYFNKKVSELNLAESAMLAGLPKAPNYFSPFLHPEAAKRRQAIVLNRMVSLGFIIPEEAEQAKYDLFRSSVKNQRDNPAFKRTIAINKAPYFVEYVRQELEERYGDSAIYKGGFRVYTTLDLTMQQVAQRVLGEGLERLNKDKKPGSPKIEGALIAVDPSTGHIKAMVGGSGFTKGNQVNRATQARRQPGSAFKPFLYTAAIDAGFTPTSILYDVPVSFNIEGAKTWAPTNYDGKFRGAVTLREALEKSINVASIKLMQEVGPDQVVKYAHAMGIEGPLTPNLSLTLGTSEATPLEMAVAYSVFANQGIKVEPMSIRFIEDQEGNLLEENIPLEQEILSKETAYIMTSLMEGVVRRGTAASSVGSKIDRPCAGKTGTTDNYVDAWFAGYTPNLTAVVWVGYDRNRKSLGRGQTGGRAAAPIWTAFMQEVLKDVPPYEFNVPRNVSFAIVDRKNGLLVVDKEGNVIKEVFIRGTEPTGYTESASVNEADTMVDTEAPEEENVGEEIYKQKSVEAEKRIFEKLRLEE
ncbi:MAG: penicillin-binding protein 1A [bacterium]